MAKSIKLSDKELVTQHIQKLDPAFGKIIETIRRITIFEDMKDVRSKAKALQKIIKEWLNLVDK